MPAGHAPRVVGHKESLELVGAGWLVVRASGLLVGYPYTYSSACVQLLECKLLDISRLWLVFGGIRGVS